MKCIVLITLACALSLDAKPFFGFPNGFNRFGHNRLGPGNMGNVDIGNGDLATGGMGESGLGEGGIDDLGGGVGEHRSQFANGENYGAQQAARGAAGGGNSAVQNSAAGNFHNVGEHHNKVTSIQQVESEGSHNVGGGGAVNQSARNDQGYGEFANGGSKFGKNYNEGSEGGRMVE